MCVIKGLVNWCLIIPELTKDIVIYPETINTMWNKKINTGDKKRDRMPWIIFTLEFWYKKCYLPYA